MKSQTRHVLASPPPLPGRREYSSRIRKRNRLIYNDHEDTTYVLSRASPRKAPRIASPPPPPPPPAPRPALPDRRIAQKVGLKLRNMLKLPKAHRWVCCEWFYSNIDQPLFLGDNEFSNCLKENFALLKCNKLTRIEWCKIRRLMGKPRRCSPEFFAEERHALEVKRAKIRQLQQRKLDIDLLHFKDLPKEIPLPLVIGTKATARVRKPQDGLFLGSIDAVDTSNSTYRITFDRQGLGTFSIPDYEVLGSNPPEMMPLSAFVQKCRPRTYYYTPPKYPPECNWPQLDNDPLLTESGIKPDLSFIDDGTLGGFPKKFLALLVRLTKILGVKKQNLDILKNMHTAAESLISHHEPLTFNFQRSYASLILDFDKLNKDLSEYLTSIQQYCQEIAPEQGLQPVVQPSAIREQCYSDAIKWVEEQNVMQETTPYVKSSETREFIASLVSLMAELKYLSTNNYNSFEFQSISDTLMEIQGNLQKENVPLFKNSVEIHINHIQSTLTQMGNLCAFSQK